MQRPGSKLLCSLAACVREAGSRAPAAAAGAWRSAASDAVATGEQLLEWLVALAAALGGHGQLVVPYKGSIRQRCILLPPLGSNILFHASLHHPCAPPGKPGPMFDAISAPGNNYLCPVSIVCFHVDKYLKFSAGITAGQLDLAICGSHPSGGAGREMDGCQYRSMHVCTRAIVTAAQLS